MFLLCVTKYKHNNCNYQKKKFFKVVIRFRNSLIPYIGIYLILTTSHEQSENGQIFDHLSRLQYLLKCSIFKGYEEILVHIYEKHLNLRSEFNF